MSPDKQVNKRVDDVCVSIGKFIQYWGFKEIEGRIWSHLLLSDKALCAQDLIDRTGVSKGLISISIARLIEYDVIKHEYTLDKRTQFFQVNPNVMHVIEGVLKSREKNILDSISNAINALKSIENLSDHNIDLSRLEYLSQMINKGSKFLESFINKKEILKKIILGKVPDLKS